MFSIHDIKQEDLPIKYESKGFSHDSLRTIYDVIHNGDIDGKDLYSYAVENYISWVNSDQYLVYKRFNNETQEYDFRVGKASKRGNDVYAYRVGKCFKDLEAIPDKWFFNYKDRNKKQKTKALFISLTYNETKYTLKESWIRYSEDYNRFMSALRSKYGSLSTIKVIEAHKGRKQNNYSHRGYPHIHIITVFNEQEFNAFHYNNAWRIEEKRTDIEPLWEHGYSDVEALASLQGGIHYVTKYLTKMHGLPMVKKTSNYETRESSNESSLSNLVSKASILTLSLLWVFKKRAYSISGGFIDLIDQLHNSNEQPQFFDQVQVDLNGFAPALHIDGLGKWELVGFWGGTIKQGKKSIWNQDLTRSEYKDIIDSSTFSAWVKKEDYI